MLRNLIHLLHVQGKYTEAEQVMAQVERLEQEAVFEGSPDELLAGPSSGIWQLSMLEEKS
jgi:hypothetical protein